VHDIKQLDDEKSQSQEVRIVERKWYETNKTCLPMSRWEIYDPAAHAEKPADA